jgi:hypothetical protein
MLQPFPNCISGVPAKQSQGLEVLGLALELQRGSNCRYSDLAIAAIKIIPAVVLTASDYIVRGHFFSAEFGACLT